VVPGPTTDQTTLIIIIVCVLGGLLLCGLLIGLLVWRAQRQNRRDTADDTRMSPVGGGAASIQSASNVPLVDSAALDTVDRQCAKCQTWLTGMVVEAEGAFWHLRCFSCDLCSRPLKIGALEHVGEHVYCASCAAEHSARPAPTSSGARGGSQQSRALAGSEIYVDDDDPVVLVDGTSEESDAPAPEAARGSRALSTDSRSSKTKGRRPSGGAKARDAEATARAKARAAAAREASRQRHEDERKRREAAKAKRAKRAAEHDDSDDSRNVDSKRSSDVRFSGVFAALDNDGDDDSDKITLGPKASTHAVKN
jgi:hypothetical protein